jgi:hypothetical protein
MGSLVYVELLDNPRYIKFLHRTFPAGRRLAPRPGAGENPSVPNNGKRVSASAVPAAGSDSELPAIAVAGSSRYDSSSDSSAAARDEFL